MADQEKNEQATEQEKGDGGGPAGKLRLPLKLLLPAGIVIICALAGYIVSGLVATSPQQADAASQAQDQQIESKEKGEEEQYAYMSLEDLSVNFDTPERLRYLSVIFVLKMRKDDHDTVEKAVEDHIPELRSWLNLYLSDQGIDEISGGRNQNRIRRRVQDKFNEMLWRRERPMISEVLCERWIIQ